MKLELTTAAGNSPVRAQAGAKEAVSQREEAQLKKACERFEGLFLSYLFRVMRETIPKSGLLGSGLWQGMFDVFFDQAIGEKVAQRARLGIAEALEKQLSRSSSVGRSRADASGPAERQAVLDGRGPSGGAPKAKGFKELDDIVSVAARAQGIDADLIRAVIDVESGGNPRAVSPKGAIGLMQLMPDTAREVGVENPFDPVQNVLGGARYLRRLLDHFEGDLRLALAAYNSGPAAVRRHGGVPPFRETVRYVEKVLSRYQTLKRLASLGMGDRASS